MQPGPGGSAPDVKAESYRINLPRIATGQVRGQRLDLLLAFPNYTVMFNVLRIRTHEIVRRFPIAGL